MRVVQIDGVLMTLIPYIHLFASDWPEGQDLTATLQGAVVSLRNCRECLQLTAAFNRTTEVAARRTQAMSVAAWNAYKTGKSGSRTLAKKQLKLLSLQNEASPFVLAQLFAGIGGMYEIFPMDGLHGISGLCMLLRFFLEKFGDAEVGGPV